MISMFGRVKVLCALMVMGFGFAAYSAAPTVTSVTAQQRYPWNGLVDITVTFNGEQGDVAKANCAFAATNSETKAALAIAHVTPQGDATGSGTTWTRRFIWDTNADLDEVKIDDVELFADVETADEPDDLGGVQLWEGGPFWAECNVGASKPEEYGLYFMWGSTEGHKPTGNQFSSGWFCSGNCPTYRKDVSELQSLGYIDSTRNLTVTHDAATAHLGAPWRMPTASEVMELLDCCDTVWTGRNGVPGRLIKGRGAYSTRSIFLPAAGSGRDSRLEDAGSNGTGHYWSSMPYPSTYDHDTAWTLGFGTGGFGPGNAMRYSGLSVRPVRVSVR